MFGFLKLVCQDGKLIKIHMANYRLANHKRTSAIKNRKIGLIFKKTNEIQPLVDFILHVGHFLPTKYRR
jgi:hypothetical protein